MWFIDPALSVLKAQWKRKYPNAVVYSIGDPDHQSKDSDHNPEADGSVDALDFMPGHGVAMGDLRDLAARLVESRDRRLHYLIIDDRIISSTTQPWKWRTYTGKKHTHLHVSRNDWNEQSTSPWNIEGRKVILAPVSGKLPELHFGDEDPVVPGNGTAYVQRFQRMVNADDDGSYGPNTKSAFKNWWKERTGDDISGNDVKIEHWKRLYGLI